MVINPTPSSLPVVTVNLPTEAVVHQNAQQQRVAPIVNVNATPAAKTSSEKAALPKVSVAKADLANTNAPASSISTEAAPTATSTAQNSSSGANSVSSDADTKSDALSPEEQERLQALKARDREVKQHEAAHANTGGDLTGAPALTYVKGPDGVLYARTGEVSIDISKVPNDPEATIRKMERVRRAALAPAEPSVQDQQIAAKAAAIAAQARAELSEAKQAEYQEQAQQAQAQRKQERQEEQDSDASRSSISSAANQRIQDLPRLIRSTGATDIEDINNLIGSRFSEST